MTPDEILASFVELEAKAEAVRLLLAMTIEEYSFPPRTRAKLEGAHDTIRAQQASLRAVLARGKAERDGALDSAACNIAASSGATLLNRKGVLSIPVPSSTKEA
ncbi:hypothetical protein [Neoroseomonas lacus]|uniref:Uncharacterized protein n=1 Tax=Neoroseomonas lacus TaxID=287609 RepID=A0A917KR69_9PROT|nr:hypothetical protein [Neoroseomonas lacus]GGJ22662.1 hypothetical protein GCM10011320_32370 [Neoroseomonas lacus]